jgi:hypothetical protein
MFQEFCNSCVWKLRICLLCEVRNKYINRLVDRTLLFVLFNGCLKKGVWSLALWEGRRLKTLAQSAEENIWTQETGSN